MKITQRATENVRQAHKANCEELWVHHESGRAMVALINGEFGWLMYLRYDGDAGFSSRNPSYQGPSDAMIEYFLSNGQLDEYPASWALPTGDVRRALREFQTDGKPPVWIAWHSDSRDQEAISD